MKNIFTSDSCSIVFFCILLHKSTEIWILSFGFGTITIPMQTIIYLLFFGISSLTLFNKELWIWCITLSRRTCWYELYFIVQFQCSHTSGWLGIHCFNMCSSLLIYSNFSITWSFYKTSDLSMVADGWFITYIVCWTSC